MPYKIILLALLIAIIIPVVNASTELVHGTAAGGAAIVVDGTTPYIAFTYTPVPDAFNISFGYRDGGGTWQLEDLPVTGPCDTNCTMGNQWDVGISSDGLAMYANEPYIMTSSRPFNVTDGSNDYRIGYFHKSGGIWSYIQVKNVADPETIQGPSQQTYAEGGMKAIHVDSAGVNMIWTYWDENWGGHSIYYNSNTGETDTGSTAVIVAGNSTSFLTETWDEGFDNMELTTCPTYGPPCTTEVIADWMDTFYQGSMDIYGDEPYYVWYGPWPDGILYYLHGGVQEQIGQSPGTVSAPDIEIGPISGTPRVVWVLTQDDITFELNYSYRDGTGWHTSQVASSIAPLSFKFDVDETNNLIYIPYSDIDGNLWVYIDTTPTPTTPTPTTTVPTTSTTPTPTPTPTTSCIEAPYGTASASSTAYGDPSWAFDDSINGNTWISGIFAFPDWLQMDYGSGNTNYVDEYGVGEYPGLEEWGPTNWTLTGSDDEVAWTTIDTRIGEPQLSGWRNYTVTSPGYYRYYRITIPDMPGETSVTEIDELALMTCGGTTPTTTTTTPAPTTTCCGHPSGQAWTPNMTFDISPLNNYDIYNGTFTKWLGNFTRTGNLSMEELGYALMLPFIQVFGMWIFLLIYLTYLGMVWIRSQDVTLPLVIGLLSAGIWGVIIPTQAYIMIGAMLAICMAVILAKTFKDQG